MRTNTPGDLDPRIAELLETASVLLDQVHSWCRKPDPSDPTDRDQMALLIAHKATQVLQLVVGCSEQEACWAIEQAFMRKQQELVGSARARLAQQWQEAGR